MSLVSVLAGLAKGGAGKLLREWALSFGSDQAEDAMSTSLRRVDWAKVADGGPELVKRVLGTILSFIPDAFLTPTAFSSATAAITASVKTSRMSDAAKQLVVAAVDAINDELRDLIREGKFDDVKRLLRSYADGTHTHRASGAKEEKMATGKAASDAGSEVKIITPPKLDWWQSSALRLLHKIVEGAAIAHDIIEIHRARRTLDRIEQTILVEQWLFEHLPQKSEKWYKKGFDLLDELLATWTRRASFDEDAPGAKEYFETTDKSIQILVRRIQREYIDEFRVFLILVNAAAERTNSNVGDVIGSFASTLGDMFDNFLTREGRDALRNRMKHLGKLAQAHGPAGLGFYGLVAAMLVSETATLLFSGLAGVLFWLLVDPGFAGIALAIPLILGLMINGRLAYAFWHAVDGHALKHTAWHMALLISVVAPAFTLFPFFWVPERQVMAIAPLLLACLMSFGFYLWLLPMDGIADTLRSHRDPEGDGQLSVLEKLFNFAAGNAEAKSLAPGGQMSRLPIDRREINIVTHFTSLIDVVTASTAWVVASLMLAPGMSKYSGSLALALIGLITGIYAAAEMFRRNRLAEYAPRTKYLLETERSIIFLRRFATQAMFWGVAFTSAVEFLFYLVMFQAGDTVLTWWGNVLGTISILWMLFAAGGVALMIGAFALLYQGARSENGLGISHGASSGLLLVAGVLLATLGFHSQDSGTLGDAILRQQAKELIDRHSSPRSPWSW